MTPGPRTHKRASLRVAIPTGLPEEMWEGTREIISLTSGDRGKGHARALMYQVCAEADRAGMVLLITPAEGEAQDRLERFYGRFGFVRVQSEPVVLMARQAQPLRIVRAA